MSNIQIPEDLFLDLYLYHVLGRTDVDTEKIKAGLEKKLDAQLRRQYYGQSKNAETPEEREAARQKYLEAAGISRNFRW